jgi:CHAT domain-containing protein
MVTKNLKDRLEAIWIALKEMEKTSAPARSAFITGMMESPLPLREIQEVLAPDEAVLVYVMDDNSRRETLIKSHVVVIRRDGAALVTLPHFGLFIHDADVSDLLKSHLWGPTEAMQILHTAMQHQASVNRGLHQADVDTPTVSPLPSAHRLYRQVVEPVRSELEGVHHLIVMADGYLGGVPFSLLVMTRPGTDADQDFTKVDWLLNRFETSYVPSLNSLVALRRETASRPAAPKAFIGFGDPIFRSSAGKTALAPLPETRDELQQIAAALLAEPDSLHFGQFATEEAVRTVGLDQYRVVAFATHGLLADGDSNIDEPALALTPGQEQGRGEDGLLSATEIATLKLNADLVLLSACNTAGVADTPQAKYRENVAGLTLPFFHAGARALLVSHWPVDSEATVLLTTRMIATGSQSNVRKSAALAEAMRRMAKGSMGARYVHPYYWAPFVIVGDGGPARR